MITEQESLYHDIEKKSIKTILTEINTEDQKVAFAVKKAIPKIEKALKIIVPKIKAGGRFFYVGAGTSGRLGVLDASELPPTFGVENTFCIPLIAGGHQAMTEAVEGAEDSTTQGWNDLLKFKPTSKDVVIGIAASGSTPYVIGILKKCIQKNIETVAITCNKNSEFKKVCDHVIEVIVGPEYISGSTRMKSGTAQKLVLNMISTTIMIQLGKIENNRMVHMKILNKKLFKRGTLLIMEALHCNAQKAESLLKKYKSVKLVLKQFNEI
ncbi:MAG: N-acetylmuramic acid 6-phosphate etherase [Alphaproteobacteria bacterium]|nr:N-acetylmuramic acid 6-phosphate etherase [Alphaproteobacteria bacterium]